MQPVEPSPTDAPSTHRDSSGVSVLGRLLWVGVLGGLVIGGVASAVLFRTALTYAVDGFSIGAAVGGVVGVGVQVLSAGALLAARRARPGLGLTRMRLVLVPLPVAAGIGLPALLGIPWAGALALGGVTAVVAWVLAPWCLAPVAPSGGPTARP